MSYARRPQAACGRRRSRGNYILPQGGYYILPQGGNIIYYLQGGYYIIKGNRDSALTAPSYSSRLHPTDPPRRISPSGRCRGLSTSRLSATTRPSSSLRGKGISGCATAASRKSARQGSGSAEQPRATQGTTTWTATARGSSQLSTTKPWQG